MPAASAALLLAALAACGELDPREEALPADPEALAAAFAVSGRADVTSVTTILGTIGTSEERSGVFDPRLAGLGYLVDAGSAHGSRPRWRSPRRPTRRG